MDLHQSAANKSGTFQALRETGWLSEQPCELADWIAAHGRWRVYKTGQVIYNFDDEADAIFGVGSGTVEVTIPVSGSRAASLLRAGQGSWFGDRALISRKQRLMTVTTTSTVRLFRLEAMDVRNLLRTRPEFWPSFFEMTYINTGRAITILSEALALTVQERLARTVIRLADETGDIAITQSDLSRILGINRSTLQRALDQMHVEGIVTSAYGKMHITDRERLTALADMS
jgi:CRP-like cAMP-binding protein